MKVTKEQANKIEVKRDTEIGDLYSYEGAHHKIRAEYLVKWAYHRLETWPDLLEASRSFIKGWAHFCDCIDFGKSNLDAEAIQFMNEAPGKIQTAKDKAENA